MKTHFIKTWPAYFERVLEGQKAFEVRKNDRDYQVGDILVLEWFDPELQPTRHQRPDRLFREVTYILHGGQFGIEHGYCVMQLSITEKSQSQQVF